jgi:hypothetical protein
MNGAKTSVVVAACHHASTGRGGLAKRPPRADNSRETPTSGAKGLEEGSKKEGELNRVMTIRDKLGRNHTGLFVPDSARLITYGMESEEVVNRIMDHWQQYIGKKG